MLSLSRLQRLPMNMQVTSVVKCPRDPVRVSRVQAGGNGDGTGTPGLRKTDDCTPPCSGLLQVRPRT